MAFRELDAHFGNALELPVRGKIYRVEDVDAETGLWAQRLWKSGADLDTEEEQAAYQRVLGSTWGDLEADGVGWQWINHVGVTALAWIAGGETLAEAIWEKPLPTGEELPSPSTMIPVSEGSPLVYEGAATTTPAPAPGSTTTA